MESWRRFTPLALWSLGLVISNAMLYRSGPRPQVISGNGVHPVQLAFLLTSVALTVGWASSLVRVVRVYVANLRFSTRLMYGMSAAVLAVASVIFSHNGLAKYEQTLHQYYVAGSLVNAYTLSYWAISLSLWFGVGCALSAVACLWPFKT
jgi:hypothetical protein